MAEKNKNRTKALFIANGIVGGMPGLTGGEVRFIEIAKGWEKRNYEIHLLSSSGGKKLCRKLGLKVILHNISRSKSVSRFTFITRFLESLILPQSLKKFNQGIVYCSSEQIYDVIPGVILKIKNPKTIKLAIVVHWLPPIKWWQRKQSSFLNSLLFLISERSGLYFGCFLADKLLAVSASTKRQIKNDLIGRFFINKTYAVNCGVNFRKIKKITQNIKRKKYEAVFMKRIQSVKGIFDLIEIWGMVVKNRPEAKLIIIGSGSEGEMAKKMVVNRKLEKNIEFLGVIYDDQEKFTRIAESKLFLLPSYEENWAIVMGEAMASKIPVLAYNLPELIEAWQDSFVQIPLGDKQFFADKIIKYLNNQTISTKQAGLGYQYVQQFEWAKIAGDELKIIEAK